MLAARGSHLDHRVGRPSPCTCRSWPRLPRRHGIRWDYQRSGVLIEAMDGRIGQRRLDRAAGQRHRLRMSGRSRGEVDQRLVVGVGIDRRTIDAGITRRHNGRPYFIVWIRHGPARNIQGGSKFRIVRIVDQMGGMHRLRHRGEIRRRQTEIEPDDGCATAPRGQHGDRIRGDIRSQPRHPITAPDALYRQRRGQPIGGRIEVAPREVTIRVDDGDVVGVLAGAPTDRGIDAVVDDGLCGHGGTSEHADSETESRFRNSSAFGYGQIGRSRNLQSVFTRGVTAGMNGHKESGDGDQAQG